jgi:uncharacterized phage-like protein YoqJ
MLKIIHKRKGENVNIVEYPHIEYDKALCFTGHRPNRLFGYDFTSEGNVKIIKRLRTLICRYIERRGIHTFVSGMALGIDMWSAMVVLALKVKYPHIKLVCAIPCAEQYSKWQQKDVTMYQNILEQANEVYYVSSEPYTNWCMVARDKWMVDNTNHVLAVWNGAHDGGTFQTVKYAMKRQRPILQLHPETLEIKFPKSIDK